MKYLDCVAPYEMQVSICDMCHRNITDADDDLEFEIAEGKWLHFCERCDEMYSCSGCMIANAIGEDIEGMHADWCNSECGEE